MIAIINKIMWEGFNLSELLYSSPYLINPPPEEGICIGWFAILYKIYCRILFKKVVVLDKLYGKNI